MRQCLTAIDITLFFKPLLGTRLAPLIVAMTEPRVGLLNSIFSDSRVEETEMAALERIAFADDGIVTAFEQMIVTENGDIQFAETTDVVRFEGLFGNASPSVRAYERFLEQRGLATRVSATELLAIAEHGAPDQLATVENLYFVHSNCFEIRLAKDGQVLVWRYSGETNLSEINKTLAPVTLWEIYFVANDALKASTPGSQQESRWLKISQTVSKVLYHDARLQEYATSVQFGSQPHMDYTVEGNKAQRLAIEGLPPLFYGEQPDVKEAQALAVGWNALPPIIQEVLAAKKVRIGLSDHTQECAELLNNGGFDMTNGFAGQASFYGNVIEMNLQRDPRTLAYALVHEIGHNLDGMFLRNAADAVLYFHVRHQKQMASGDALKGFATTYSTANTAEYFAELFAIVVLQDTNVALEGGFYSLFKAWSQGFPALAQDLKRSDPLGFLMMTKCLSLVNAGRAQEAWKAFSWSGYAQAQSFLAANGATLDGADLAVWNQLEPDTAFEADFEKKRRSHRGVYSASWARELEVICSEHPDFYPAQQARTENVVVGFASGKITDVDAFFPVIQSHVAAYPEDDDILNSLFYVRAGASRTALLDLIGRLCTLNWSDPSGLFFFYGRSLLAAKDDSGRVWIERAAVLVEKNPETRDLAAYYRNFLKTKNTTCQLPGF